MQVVDLEGRELIEVALDVIDPEEVPGDVEHHAAVGVPRVVHDVDGRHRPHRSGRPDQLPQRLSAPEQPGCRIRADPDALSSSRKGVALVGMAGGRRTGGDGEDDVPGTRRSAVTGSANPVSERNCPARCSATDSPPWPATTIPDAAVSTNGGASRSVIETGSGTSVAGRAVSHNCPFARFYPEYKLTVSQLAFGWVTIGERLTTIAAVRLGRDGYRISHPMSSRSPSVHAYRTSVHLHRPARERRPRDRRGARAASSAASATTSR